MRRWRFPHHYNRRTDGFWVLVYPYNHEIPEGLRREMRTDDRSQWKQRCKNGELHPEANKRGQERDYFRVSQPPVA